MAIRVVCRTPQQLLDEIKAAIRSGVVETWLLDDDGDFTHAPAQWKYKAWLRPRISPNMLTFSILGPKTEKMSKAVYGVYHGRFIEMLLTHFDLKFSEATTTALVAPGDWVMP